MIMKKPTRIRLKQSHKKVVLLVLSILCLTPVVSPPVALLSGIIVAQLFENPFPESSKKAINWLLKASVVGLGFGMNVTSALKAGKDGFIFTVVSVFGTLTLGYLLGKLLKVGKITSFLISGGTAICGGSAIAALAPVVNARQNHISVALGVIFILNSIALFVYPFIGHLLGMSQYDFGMWCAIAIHDTSSVVGASAKYGNEALAVATTVKLARALWIIPVAFLSTFVFKNKNKKIKIPYFIGLFILAVVMNTFLPGIEKISPYIINFSKAGLTLTLFLIGTGLSSKLIKSVGIQPVLQGTILWLIISVSTLMSILYF